MSPHGVWLSPRVQQGIPENGPTLPAPPFSWFQIVAWSRNLIRIQFGTNEASLLRHEIVPILVVPSLLSQCRRLFAPLFPNF